MSDKWEFVERRLADLAGSRRLRALTPRSASCAAGRIVVDGRVLINLGSNDYLGLSGDPRLAEAAHAAARAWGLGATGSRLISGNTALHEEMEAGLAGFHGAEAALSFSSGYAAAVGIVPALVGKGDCVFLDRLCHACLYDGARLSQASLHRFRHLDPAHLDLLLKKNRTRDGKALVITDTVFSMDGDRAPLSGIAALCGRYDALLLVDEAHAVGVLGPQGKGLAAEAGLDPAQVPVMGTLGKAFGVNGAYLACSASLRDYLVNTCRSFIYTTAPPAPLAAAVTAAIGIVSQADPDRARLAAMAERFRARLKGLGADTAGSSTQIVPAIVGGADQALDLARALRSAGIFAPAVRPPTVPEGTCRIRFSLTAALTEQDFDQALEVVYGVLEKMSPR